MHDRQYRASQALNLRPRTFKDWLPAKPALLIYVSMVVRHCYIRLTLPRNHPSSLFFPHTTCSASAITPLMKTYGKAWRTQSTGRKRFGSCLFTVPPLGATGFFVASISIHTVYYCSTVSGRRIHGKSMYQSVDEVLAARMQLQTHSANCRKLSPSLRVYLQSPMHNVARC